VLLLIDVDSTMVSMELCQTCINCPVVRTLYKNNVQSVSSCQWLYISCQNSITEMIPAGTLLLTVGATCFGFLDFSQ